MYSFAAFCLVLALALPAWGWWGFATGVGVSLGMLLITKRLVLHSSNGKLNEVDA
jgi:hypothetical protein